MKYLFYLSAVLCGYSYFLYPLILKMIPPRYFQKTPQANSHALPALCQIITVHNEAYRIREKLDNTLQIDYPRELLDIIVASDCSDDATDENMLERRLKITNGRYRHC